MKQGVTIDLLWLDLSNGEQRAWCHLDDAVEKVMYVEEYDLGTDEDLAQMVADELGVDLSKYANFLLKWPNLDK